jgi:hypothetical protein
VPSSIFLSHAHADKSAARQLSQALVQAGLRCWFDEAEINPGDSILDKVQSAIDDMDYLGVVLSRTSVTSQWVQAELKMAMTNELSEPRVRVIPILIESCDSRDIPGFLRDKSYIDLRTNFRAGADRLISFLSGVAPAFETPKQGVLAEIVENADDELWRHLARNPLLRQSSFAQLIRSLTDDELVAAVAIAANWKYQQAYDNHLLHLIQHHADCDLLRARIILDRLVAVQLLEPIADLPDAYTGGDALLPLRNCAMVSGVFDFLPPPPQAR